jgi:hypothetical protein
MMSGRLSALLIALVGALSLTGGGAQAASRMPIGFFDDPSFRWSSECAQNLAAAAAAGATVIRTTANWAAIAPTRPVDPADADDAAYHLQDLDQLVAGAGQYGLRVMINITGTPRWANGGQTQNHMPLRLSDLATFVRMLALRYDGRNPGKGAVGLWSVWNEPNLQQFLTPQYAGKKIVSPANYAKLFKTVYAAIKSQNPWAKVAIGETSAQGRDRPSTTSSQTVSPGMFAKLLAREPGLRFDAWAQHPYPTWPGGKPLEKVNYPNVTLSELPMFERQLATTFHRPVPIWITEYGHQTKPANPRGVTYAQQAVYASEALRIAKSDPNVQLFVWFTFRDSAGNPWQSGIEQPTGLPKPAFGPFSSLAHLIDGTTVTTEAGIPPTITMYVAYIAYHNLPGGLFGITYHVYDNGRLILSGEPTSPLAPDQSVTFTPTFTPELGHTYAVIATINDPNGNVETRTAVVLVK